MLTSIFLFLLASLAKTGGDYLVWLWLREGKPLWAGLLGGLILVFYGILPTLQPAVLDFGRLYATYGGLFTVLSLLWGWLVDGKTPDLPSVVGASVALIGAAVIVHWPRIT